MKTTKPLYIAIGMVLGAAVLALIAAAPSPSVLNVPGISIRTNGVEVSSLLSIPGGDNQFKVYNGNTLLQIDADSTQASVYGQNTTGLSYFLLKAADGAGSSAFQLNSGNGSVFFRPASASTDTPFVLTANTRTNGYLFDVQNQSVFALRLAYDAAFPTNAAQYLDGTGHWTDPLGGGSAVWTNSSGSIQLVSNPGVISISTNAGINGITTLTSGILNLGDNTGALSTILDSVEIVNIGDGAGSSVSITNCSDLFNMGSSAGQQAILDGVNQVYSIGDDAGWMMTGTNSGNIYNIGLSCGFASTYTNTSQVFNFGSSAGASSSYADSIDVYNIGDQAGASSAISANSSDIYSFGNNANFSQTFSGKTHMMVIGSGGKSTNSNDWVAGDGAYNYFFPGASATFDGPITAKQGISAGGTSPSYFTNGVQDATLTANTIVGNDGTNKLVSATLAMLTNTAAADGNAAHYWNGQGGWTAPVAGSTNITDSGYTADIRNATIATNLTAGSATINTNLAINGQSGFAGFAAGSLPSGVAVGYQTYCTDCLTPWGVGDRVEWDGSVWRTMRVRVLATTNMAAYILSCVTNAITIHTPISDIETLTVVGGTVSSGTIINGTLQRQTFGRGTGGTAMQLTGANAYGAWARMGAGTAQNDCGYEYGILFNSIQTSDVYAMGGSYCISAAPDGTDNYITYLGFNNVNATNWPIANFVGIVYDKQDALARTPGVATNHWNLEAVKTTSSTEFADTGFTPTVSAGAAYDRLAIIVTGGTGASTYTNGVVAATVTATDLPTGTLYANFALNYKNAGSTSRYLYEVNPWYHVRRATAHVY